MKLAGSRVTVMGLGHFGGGVAAARWLARQDARVTVTDLASEERLRESLSELADSPIAAFHLGGHCEEDFRNADLVVVNPAVRPEHPLLALAAESGARLTSEIELFLEACPASMVGVTGSNGKSTTAAMTSCILRADGRRTWLGGNIGGSLLDQLSGMSGGDWVVLELSSFQLCRMAPDAKFPQVAIVTNCTPNHLNWHPDFAHYVAAKQRLLTEQAADGLAVLNTLDPEVASWSSLVRGRLLPLLPLEAVPPLRVPGIHNRVNAACAATAAAGIGCSEQAIELGLRNYSALPQRLERIAVVGGRRFYNDSSSTTPESTVAALEALEEPTWLLAGGSDKGADLAALAQTIAARAAGAAFFGQIGPSLHRRIAECGVAIPTTLVATLAEALHWCWKSSEPGHAVLLSPGCASLDQFVNFRQRGEVFNDLVRGLLHQR